MKLHRRSFLFAGLALAAPRPATWILIGGNTDGAGQGIERCRFDSRDGMCGPVELAAETPSPTFLALHPSQPVVYAVNEIDNYQGKRAGALSAFRLEGAGGKLTLLNQVSSMGPGPCHLAADRTGRMLMAANYNGGSVVFCPIRADGSLGQAASFIQHSGHGPNPQRQGEPHAHAVVVDASNRFAVVADLGTDELRVYRIDPSTATLAAHSAAKVEPGAGPRHFAFHPAAPFAYVVDELDSTITTLAWDAAQGTLQPLARVSTLPPGFSGANSTAELTVHPTGKFVYASNRGHDSIAVFRCADGGRTLLSVQHVPTDGKTPRNFVLSPDLKWLLAANQQSDTVAIFALDPGTGKLRATGRQLRARRPACLLFV